jgi:hypothetical protein
MLRGSVKSIGYPLHSSVSPSPPLPCFTVCHHISTGLYLQWSTVQSKTGCAVVGKDFGNIPQAAACMTTLHKVVMSWRGHVERVGMRKLHSWFWRENPKKRDDFEKINLVLRNKIILKPIFKKQNGRAWTGFVWFRFWIIWLAVV